MRKEDCYELGYITRPHALAGEVAVMLDVDSPEDYAELDSVFLEVNRQLVPYFVETLTFHRNRFIIKFEDVETIEDAEKLRGCKLYLPLDVLPELEEGQFYYHEITGFTCIDEKEGEIGTVKAVYTGGPQDILAIDHNGVEVLVPIHDDLVKGIEREKNEIYVSLPEGLIDLYKDA
ncbi:ribosome maturation factor RimM [Sediminitomix flava]|uniref:Ribosome maturation factor RimM n=1 Tax=Sediminitomix flava TaxID=379075 RepID=A0A315ZDM9_SEDFL|nr:ribosome maturation factor RimM [Sediminitomix flava]PWJ42958.1 16S rRNA processing protein RimM [Sediminitomix flava]